MHHFPPPGRLHGGAASEDRITLNHVAVQPRFGAVACLVEQLMSVRASGFSAWCRHATGLRAWLSQRRAGRQRTRSAIDYSTATTGDPPGYKPRRADGSPDWNTKKRQPCRRRREWTSAHARGEHDGDGISRLTASGGHDRDAQPVRVRSSGRLPHRLPICRRKRLTLTDSYPTLSSYT